MSFYFSIWIIITVIILHRLHIILLGDCVLSNMQHESGTLDAKESFFQHATKKFTGASITPYEGIMIDNLLIWLVLAISLTRTIQRSKSLK